MTDDKEGTGRPLQLRRGRPPRKEDDPLTPKAAAFVEAMSEGLSKTAACKEAGFADPAGEADRLLKRPGVINALVKALQQTGAKWTHIKALSMNALLDVLTLREYNCEHCGKPTRYPRVDPKTRASAALGALGVLAKIGDGKTLGDRAEQEDAPMSAADASKAVVGRSAVSVGGVPMIPVSVPPKDSTH